MLNTTLHYFLASREYENHTVKSADYTNKQENSKLTGALSRRRKYLSMLSCLAG